MRYNQFCWIHLLLIYSSSAGVVLGFHLPSTTINGQYYDHKRVKIVPHVGAGERISAVQPLHFWGNKDKNSEDTEGEPASNLQEVGEESAAKASRGGLVGRLPFFANKDKDEKDAISSDETEQPVVAAAATTTTTAPSQTGGPTAGSRVKQKEEELDPVKKAQALRAQAERARLEAEKMDAELTLQKISRLEREMATAVSKDETDDVERLQREMDTLQAKIRGEKPPPPPQPAAITPPKKREEDVVKIIESTGADEEIKEIMEKIEVMTPGSTLTETVVLPGDGGIQLPVLKKIDEEEFDSVKAQLESSPGFIKKLLAQMTEVDFNSADDVNVTEVTKRMIQMQNFDFSYSSKAKPAFTQSEIDAAIQENLLSNSKVQTDSLPDGVKGNATAEALLALEYNYYADSYDMSKMNDLLEGEDWLKDVIKAVNASAVDSSIEVLYPKCTRKEGAAIPTMAQVQMLIADVLPKASFTVRGKPEEVAGGFIVRGASKFETGDETIAAIDEQLDKSPMLKDKMTVLYTTDFTLLAQQQEEEEEFDPFGDFVDPADEPPILYIMGPDILPERKRIPLAITTAFGIATSWYLSVYPFLLNPALLKRAEEQLELADASMAYDLSWLSELSFPLFVTFVGIQLAHEAGHKLVGAANGVKSTLPTFVPSLITGHTSSVTQFKELPKNAEALFDFAIAGPLFGILASLAALVVGSQLTLVSDPAVLPALPLDILRQSTLGGGIIDAILGNGALSVPPGAELTTAVQGMTVSLHPVAVAGYIGLIVNSLALLPIGTTDGGRIALSVFGRQAKPFIGNIFLITIFLVGFSGSDLFLFYFAFLSAFQTGNEIPARNEVDSISFPRVLLATGTTVLALLTLIPFQS